MTTAAASAPRRSQASVLVDLALGSGLVPFRDAAGLPHATVDVDGHLETWRMRATGLRAWLARQYHRVHRAAPNAAALADAVQTLAGIAQYDGDVEDVHVRLAERDGRIYLDLVDSGWRVVEIAPTGWRVLDASPVRFRRTKGMQTLPEPSRGGRVDDLRHHVNVSDADWRLVASWLLGTLRPGRPFPVLAIYGEHGSGKSTQARMLRRLIDPNLADLRRPPREERDLVIAAANGWLIGLDNVSSMPAWLSDGLCCVSTGAGFATRTLYTDEDESLFAVRRPVLLTSIEDVIVRDDLADRALLVTLPRIADTARKTEAELWAAYETDRPGILGALLAAASAALRGVAAVRLAAPPRMADFAAWASAAEQALGWESGSYLDAHTANRRAAAETVIEASPIGPPLLALLHARGGSWQGTASALLQDLAAIADESSRHAKSWPASPRALAGLLRRLLPELRLVGIEAAAERTGHGRQRTWSLHHKEDAEDRPLRPHRPQGPAGGQNLAPDADANPPPAEPDRPRPSAASAEKSSNGAAADDADDADAEMQPFSDERWEPVE